MSQSRTLSAVEAGTNVAVGWVVALGTQLLFFPVVGLQATLAQTMTISGAFTAVSLVRSYVLRRVFATLGQRSRPPLPTAWGEGGGSISVAFGGGTARGALLTDPQNWRGGISRLLVHRSGCFLGKPVSSTDEPWTVSSTKIEACATDLPQDETGRAS
jgi:hypothetical protein